MIVAIRLVIILSLSLVHSLAYATFILRDFTEADGRVHHSHYTITFDMGVLMYESFHDFNATVANISSDDNLLFYGGALNFGRNFKITKRWWTHTEGGLFMFQRLDRNTLRAREDLDYDVSITKEDHRIYGLRVAQSLKYRIPRGRGFYIEPLVQVSLNYGIMDSRTNYYYDDTIIENLESYSGSIKEDIYMLNYALGVNFLWETGVSLAAKAQANAITVGTRRTDIVNRPRGGNIEQLSSREEINTTRNDLGLSLTAGFIF